MTELYRITLFVAYTFLSSCLLLSGVSGFAQESTTPPQEQQAFSLNPDDLGALENSVNLFTGQVAFPMSLASLPDASGLGISVAIQYNSSGIAKQSTTWNADAPTGILGLGWSMELPRIVVDHKQTGTRHDDKFYVVEGGQSIALACIKSGSGLREYKPVKDAFWKVTYNTYQEKWEIIKEDGTKFIYGDEDSERNTVQWMVKWGNWIGSSTQPSGQKQMAYVWNLSEVENLWGQKLTYTYDPVEEYVAKDINNLTTEKKHTKASYLKKITSPGGKSVEFIYGEKLAREYQDPHTEQSEPDAYQEKYETRFLDRLVARNETNELLYEIALGYRFLGEEALTKRTLTSIRSIYPSGRSMPPLRFAYSQETDYLGMLKKVTNSYGAYYEYSYQNHTLPLSQLDKLLSPPNEGGSWDEQYVYTGNNYALVVWRTTNSDGSHNPGYRPCQLNLYTWDGQWHEEVLQESIKMRTRKNYDDEWVLDWQLTLGNNFFAYLHPRKDYPSQQAGGIYMQSPYQAQVWNLQSIGGNANTQLLSGSDFVALSSRNNETIKTYIFDGVTGHFEDIDVDEHGAELYVSAANNYIFVHNDNFTGQDYVHVFYLDEEKKWNKSSASSTQLFRTDDGDGVRPSYWHSFNSFTLGLLKANEEFIYQWDEQFNNIKRISGWGKWDDDSFVFSRNNTMLSIAEKPKFGIAGSVAKGKSARYDGRNWNFTDIYNNAHPKNVGFGSDFLIRNQAYWNSPYDAHLSYFNPNNNTWTSNILYDPDVLTYLNTKQSNNKGVALEAGGNFFSMSDGYLYQRDFQENWNFFGRLPLGDNEYMIGNSLVLNTPFLIAYEYSKGASNDATGSYLVFLKNGEITHSERFAGLTFDTRPAHVGGSIVVHAKENKDMILRKIVDGEWEGALKTTQLSQLRWYDGNTEFYNTYDYDLAIAKSDPSGLIPHFNKVRVIPGSKVTAEQPYGATDYFFYNGLPAESIELSISPTYLHSYDQLRLGVPYATQVINSQGNTVMLSQQEFNKFNFSIANSEEVQVAQVHYLRSTASKQQANGITQRSDQTYNEHNGLVKTVMQTVYQPGGNSNYSPKQSITYWYEKYDEDRSENILTPRIKTIVTWQNQTVSATATTWKEWGYGKWAPEKSYQWLRGGSTDFDSWNPDQQPSASDWKLGQTITARREQAGNVLESSNPSGLHAASLYDELGRSLAGVQLADLNQIAYTSFERYSSGQWIYSEDQVSETDALTGRRAFSSASATIQSASLPAGQYTLSYWAQDNVPTVSGGSVLHETQQLGPNGWTYHEKQVSLATSGSLTISPNGVLDELRLYPQHAEMMAYTYHDNGQLDSETAPNGQFTRYQYDDMNRPVAIRDHRGEIVKRYRYRYRDEDEHYSVLLAYEGEPAANEELTFTATHPAYAEGEAQYTWTFGEETITTTEPTVTRAFPALGSYPVRVEVSYSQNPDVVAHDSRTLRITQGTALTISVALQAGSSETIEACEANAIYETVSVKVTASNGGCPGYTYRWFREKDGEDSPTSLGTGTQETVSFNAFGTYRVYCVMTDGCGTTQRSASVTVTVQYDYDQCGTELDPQ